MVCLFTYFKADCYFKTEKNSVKIEVHMKKEINYVHFI